MYPATVTGFHPKRKTQTQCLQMWDPTSGAFEQVIVSMRQALSGHVCLQRDTRTFRVVGSTWILLHVDYASIKKKPNTSF